MSMTREDLRDAARKAFGTSGLMPDAAQSWTRLTEMGWFMMTVPEALGGLGLGREALGAIHYELGRALVPGPAIAQMLVVEALCHADASAERNDLLARAIGGEVMTATLCHAPDADRASMVLTIADEQIALAPITAATRRATWDETRRLFEVETGDALIMAKVDCEHLQSQLLFALAADSLGGADALLEMTIDYLKTRRQFDRPLALFQALKHRVADLKVALGAAEALLWSRVSGEVTLAEMGALKALATRTYLKVAEEAVQLHGGIGLTEEHPCHRFLKRAWLNAALGGDADYWDEYAGRAALAALGEQR